MSTFEKRIYIIKKFNAKVIFLNFYAFVKNILYIRKDMRDGEG
jgi:hypothetical protein